MILMLVGNTLDDGDSDGIDDSDDSDDSDDNDSDDGDSDVCTPAQVLLGVRAAIR